MSYRKFQLGLLVVGFTVGLSRPASAAIVVTSGNLNADTDNVISEACEGNIEGPALTVQGCFNSDHTYFVNFTSDENLTISGGQASIEASDGSFSQMDISLDSGDTFSKIVLNIDATADGSVTFTGTPGGTSTTFALTGSGSNFFTITGEDFFSVFFATTVGIISIDLVADLAQVRIGGIETPEDPLPAVPEPATMTLVGLGLLGAAGMARRRRGLPRA